MSRNGFLSNERPPGMRTEFAASARRPLYLSDGSHGDSRGRTSIR
jgi:hypothetical protein